MRKPKQISSSRVGAPAPYRGTRDPRANEPYQTPTYVYMLRCADGSFYTGVTRNTLEERLDEHNSGTFPGYTQSRRPVELAWSQDFQWASDAITMERRVKGWSRRKKIALIEQDWDRLKKAAKKKFDRND